MKAYIFDLDGTLFDSTEVWLNIDIEFLKKRGITAPDDYAGIISPMSFPEAAAYTINRFNLPEGIDSLLQEWGDMAVYAYGNTVQLKPYAKEYLAELRKHKKKLAVATSSIRELYEPALRNHGIYDWFDVICDASEAGCGKTRPDIFLITASKLGVEPCECIVFEDIPAAVKSAKSISMKVYGVFDNQPKADWEKINQEADGIISGFRYAPKPRSIQMF